MKRRPMPRHNNYSQESHLYVKSLFRSHLINFVAAATCMTCLLFFTVVSYAEEERVFMELSAPLIYEGESTVLSVTVVNSRLDEEPNIDNLKEDFEVNSLGSSNHSSVNVQYANGVPTRVETKAVIYQFELRPKKSGSLTICSPLMKVNGKEIAAPPVTLTVKGTTQTDLVLLESSLSSNEEIYPLVPFEVTVDVLIKEPPENFAEGDILGLITQQLGAPQLTIPWLQSRSINANTVVDEELEDWLNSMSNSDSGFALNNFQLSRSPFDFGFSFFDERRPAMFLPKPERVERKDSSGQTVGYLKYSFKRQYRAQTPTTLYFSASMLKGTFVNFNDPQNPQPEQIYITSHPLTVTIKTIPENQTPDNYSGIYGSVKQTVTVSSTDVAKGDAFTLTIAYKGYGAFEGAKAPDLDKLLAQDEKFKTYPASERSLENGVAFDYKIRPLEKGTQTIPSIKTSYFDVESKDFIEEESSPIKINVRESLLTPTDEDEESVSEKRIKANKDNETLTLARQLEAEKKKTRAVLQILCIIVGLLFVMGLVFGAFRFVQFNRRRIAVSNKRIIENAEKQLELGFEQLSDAPMEGLQSLRIAFIQLIGKQFVQSVEALTDAEIVEFFERELDLTKTPRFFKLDKQDETTRSESLVTLKQMRDFYRRAEQIRFGGARNIDENLKKDVSILFQAWVKLISSTVKKLSSVAISDIQK